MFKVIGNKIYVNNCLFFYPEKFCLLRSYPSHQQAVFQAKKLAKTNKEKLVIEKEFSFEAMMERDA